MADSQFLKPTYRKGQAEFSVPYYVQAQGASAPSPATSATLKVTSGRSSCSMGTSPGALVTIPPNRAGNIFDAIPLANITPCGMCTSPANPQVAASTAAAQGNLIPAPCIPVTTQWNGGSPTDSVQGAPALLPSSMLMCAWSGVIMITWPGPPQA